MPRGCRGFRGHRGRSDRPVEIENTLDIYTLWVFLGVQQSF